MRFKLEFEPGGIIELPDDAELGPSIVAETAVRSINRWVVEGPKMAIEQAQRDLMNSDHSPDFKSETWAQLEQSRRVVEAFCRHLGFSIEIDE